MRTFNDILNKWTEHGLPNDGREELIKELMDIIEIVVSGETYNADRLNRLLQQIRNKETNFERYN